MELFTVTYHHHVKPNNKAKSFKENQCIVEWGHATSQVGGNVEPQKYQILFIFHISFITLFLFFPSIKPLISIIFMTKYGLPCYFPNHLFFSILSEFVVNYLQLAESTEWKNGLSTIDQLERRSPYGSLVIHSISP